MPKLGSSDNPQWDAEELQKRNSQHTHYTGAKPQHEKFPRIDEAPLIPEGQMFAGKNIPGILHHQEKNGQQHRQDGIGQGAARNQVQGKQKSHKDNEDDDLLALVHHRMHGILEKYSENKRLVIMCFC